MPKLTDTYARAYAACGEVLSALGRFPTIELIRERIGVNNPATIKRAINDWTAAMAVESRERLVRPGVPEALLDATAQIWRLAQDEAAAHLSEARAQLDHERQTGATEWAALRQVETTLRQELEAARQAVEHERAQREAQRAEAEAARQREAALTEALAQAREAQAELNGRLTEALAAQARLKAEWEARFEDDHRWHLRRIEEEKGFARQAAADQLAQRDAALAQAQQRLDTLTGQWEHARQTCGELTGENRLLREAVAQLEARQTAWLQELEAVRQQVRDTQTKRRPRTAKPKTPSPPSTSRDAGPKKKVGRKRAAEDPI